MYQISEKDNADKPKISCLIIEDEAQSRSYVKDILVGSDEFSVILEAKDLKEAEVMITSNSPQLLVMDINLPDGDSFELLDRLRQTAPGKEYKIIFTTAYATYAVEAFKYSALDYLLKPFTPDDLLNAVHKVLRQMDMGQFQEQLETFFLNFKEKEHDNKKIVLKSTDNIHIVKVMDIFQAVSDNNYTIFHLCDGERITVSQPLKSYETKLAPCGFMRIHQSHLVNLRYIKSFQKKNNLLVLENDITVPVSQNKRALLMAYFESLS
ncbi:LytR/AlgR family response regulator transcription factor [Belliella marina]|uniref:LytR/AlgR family response regulator transcription factor n=1 Tax=Belliella marina TaxID=1644146 RepID=A0ABW4VLL4_9BACT